MRKDSTHVIVRSGHPWLKLVLFVFLILAVIAAGWWLFEHGRSRAGFDITEARHTQEMLSGRIAALESENRRLNTQIVVLEQAGEIDRHANDKVLHNLTDLQNEVLELRQEVEFYRAIILSEDAAPGLKIQSFKLRQDSEPQVYRYRLILTQLAMTNPQIRGKVEIVVSGIKDGAQISLSDRDLAGETPPDVEFRFRHFQELRGSLTLPPGFVPLRVMLKAVPGGNIGSPIEQTFSWSELIS